MSPIKFTTVSVKPETLSKIQGLKKRYPKKYYQIVEEAIDDFIRNRSNK